LVVGVGALAAAFGSSYFAEAEPSPKPQGSPQQAPQPSQQPPGVEAVVAVRARVPHGLAARTDLRRLTVTDDGVRAAVRLTSIEHPSDAIVRGDVAQRGARFLGVALAVDELPKNADFGAALHFVDPTGVDRRLATGLVHASRPLVAEDGQIFIQRGSIGALPAPAEIRAGTLRTDPLEIDAVDPASGAIRVVMTWNGYATHIAGAYGRELVVYRVGARGAEIVAVDRGSGRTRTVAALPPFARDFSIDPKAGAVVFSNRDDRDESTWVVERMDLSTGARTRLSTTRDDAQTPLAAGGRIFWTAPGRKGLASDRAAAPLTPLGEGYTYASSATADGEWLSLVHVPNGGGFDRMALYRPKTGKVVTLGGASERVEVLGLLETGSELR
jgi:hypothetical protein